MTHSSVPYVPGPSSAPISPPVPVHHAAQPPSPGPVVGASVDLAHELGALRKLQTTNMLISGVAMVFALFAALFAGYVAITLYRFVDALDKAFG